MKIGLAILLFLAVLIFCLKVLGLTNTSPLLLFASSFGVASIIGVVAFIAFAKDEKERHRE